MDGDDQKMPAIGGNDATAVQLPWVEKYRPQRLEDLVAQDDIVQTLTSLIDSDNLPHLLLYGPPGTGKTSTIVAAAKRMYKTAAAYSAQTLELNASDARGIDVVRNEIKEFAGTKQLFSKGIKLIILDEADAMTSDAQFALRRIIEKYTRNCRFCLICNYVSKIIPALQSRCTRFRFGPLHISHIASRLTEVAVAEHVNLTDSGRDAILRLCHGDMRRVLNLLQSTAMSVQASTADAALVDETAVYLTSGAPLPDDVDVILTQLLNATFAVGVQAITALCTQKGYALADVLFEITERVVALELESAALGQLLEGMADIEYRLAFGTDEKLQTASLMGVFVKTREMIQAK